MGFRKTKKIIAGMEKVIEATYSKDRIALGVGVYAIYDFAGFNPKCLTAILNSKFLSYYLNNKFKEKHLAGGYLAINKGTLEQLPLVDIDEEKQELLAYYVNKIYEINKSDKKESTIDLEKSIDDIIYKLYDLSEEEINLIENFYGGK